MLTGNINDKIDPKHGKQIAEFTAGTTYDDVAHVTSSMDRLNQNGSLADSCCLAIMNTTTIAADKKLGGLIAIDDSSDDGSWDGYTTLTSAEVTVVAGLTTDDTAVYQYGVDLRGKKRYVRFRVALDLNATDTDTAEVAIMGIMGGYNITPTS